MHTQDAIDMVPSLPWLEETKSKGYFFLYVGKIMQM